MKSKETFFVIENFIDSFHEEYGISPSVAEIAKGVGLSAATISRNLQKMREKGIVEYAGKRSLVTRGMKERRLSSWDDDRKWKVAYALCRLKKYGPMKICSLRRAAIESKKARQKNWEEYQKSVELCKILGLGESPSYRRDVQVADIVIQQSIDRRRSEIDLLTRANIVFDIVTKCLTDKEVKVIDDLYVEKRGWPTGTFYHDENTGSISRIRKRAFMKLGDLAQNYLSDEEADRILEENKKKQNEFV